MDPVTSPPTAPSTPKPQQAGQGDARATVAADAEPRLVTEGITVHYGNVVGVRDVSLTFRDKTVTALIGPSGCGKTTYLRSLNRMHDLTRGVKVGGRAVLDGTDIYANGVDPVTIRRRIGMVFQKPTPFPTMSIYDNVVAGLKLVGIRDRALLDEVAERSLRQAALWDEVKDRLKAPAAGISGGQQQRLSIARAVAVEDEVLLMDDEASRFGFTAGGMFPAFGMAEVAIGGTFPPRH
ncbi:MAG: ATP-binding cassette domain-containing protein, partial [Trueperaceae bacterium]